MFFDIVKVTLVPVTETSLLYSPYEVPAGDFIVLIYFYSILEQLAWNLLKLVVPCDVFIYQGHLTDEWLATNEWDTVLGDLLNLYTEYGHHIFIKIVVYEVLCDLHKGCSQSTILDLLAVAWVLVKSLQHDTFKTSDDLLNSLVSPDRLVIICPSLIEYLLEDRCEKVGEVFVWSLRVSIFNVVQKFWLRIVYLVTRKVSIHTMSGIVQFL